MKLITILAIILFFTIGCVDNMTNEEIIIEKDKCLNADMDYRMVKGILSGSVERVVCVKKRNDI